MDCSNLLCFLCNILLCSNLLCSSLLCSYSVLKCLFLLKWGGRLSTRNATRSLASKSHWQPITQITGQHCCLEPIHNCQSSVVKDMHDAGDMKEGNMSEKNKKKQKTSEFYLLTVQSWCCCSKGNLSPVSSAS